MLTTDILTIDLSNYTKHLCHSSAYFDIYQYYSKEQTIYIAIDCIVENKLLGWGKNYEVLKENLWALVDLRHH